MVFCVKNGGATRTLLEHKNTKSLCGLCAPYAPILRAKRIGCISCIGYIFLREKNRVVVVVVVGVFFLHKE